MKDSTKGNTAILLLGSNLGHREKNISSALKSLASSFENILSVSSVYQTQAWGNTSQAEFLNLAVCIRTDLTPLELLNRVLAVETSLGRTRSKKWEDRTIDIDILFMDGVVVNSELLKIPHLHLHERRFALIPILEIAPEWIHPTQKLDVKTLLENCIDQSEVAVCGKVDPKTYELILNVNSIRKLDSKINFIVIEGNIGAGKTTFAKRFAEEHRAKLVLERFADNPFLPKFYENPKQYAFPLELSFLAERFQQLRSDLAEQDLFSEFTVSDYLFQKCMIFASVNLPADEFSLYSTFFSVMKASLPKPDLLVYLHQDVSRLKENIKKRGRVYEESISDDYLKKIESGYFGFFKQHIDQKTLIIDVTEKDFVHNTNDYEELVSQIYEISLEPRNT